MQSITEVYLVVECLLEEILISRMMSKVTWNLLMYKIRIKVRLICKRKRKKREMRILLIYLGTSLETIFQLLRKHLSTRGTIRSKWLSTIFAKDRLINYSRLLIHISKTNLVQKDQS